MSVTDSVTAIVIFSVGVKVSVSVTVTVTVSVNEHLLILEFKIM